jgi:aminoglycoside phosphotransferase (APT) family kinase protein
MPQRQSIVHGEFRLDKLIFHKTEIRIIAVFDWEMSSIGNPFSDLSSLSLIYHFPTGVLPGLGNFDKGLSGIPTEIKMRDTYLQKMNGLGEISEQAWSFFLTYNLFKGAAIA